MCAFSLSVAAEPFAHPPEPVSLDLCQLPQGLTSLELRNIDVITPPAALNLLTPLSQLNTLRLESCRLRTPQLRALAETLPELQQLRLANVSGLTDDGVAALSVLTALNDLAVLAPLNRSLTQTGMRALAPLKALRCAFVAHTLVHYLESAVWVSTFRV